MILLSAGILSSSSIMTQTYLESALRHPTADWGMSRNKTIFVVKRLRSVERQTHDVTVSPKMRCTVMLFGHRTILQCNKLT